jgi:hypothetical protein
VVAHLVTSAGRDSLSFRYRPPQIFSHDDEMHVLVDPFRSALYISDISFCLVLSFAFSKCR